jgi:hypothetical protein
MRKKAGFLIMTLLLLALPALANAWTLAVKVAGGTDTNNVTVAYGTPAVQRTFQSTVSYLYPVGKVTITDHAAASSITFDGAPLVQATFVSPTSGNHTLEVAYKTTQTNFEVGITQAAGGMIYAQNRNNTWSSTAVTGLVSGASVPVAIAADSNHKIESYTLNGTDFITAGLNGLAGQVLSTSALATGQKVTANFALVGKISASLFAPTNGVTGKTVYCAVTATSNASDLQYAFAVTGPASFSQAVSGIQSFSFTPAAVGTYTVTATVTSAGTGSTTASASIVVAEARADANSGCVSCHSTQPSKHPITGLGDSCSGCHGATPHDVAVATHSGAQEANCFNCHASPPHYDGTAFLKAQYVSAASLPISCADCHGEGVSATANQAILEQFAKSAHGDPAGEAWIHYDWRSGNRSSCARCHAGTAFAAKLGHENDTTSVFLPGDLLKPGESLACSACHANAGTGELRVAAEEFTINMRNGATVTYDVAGASALCARCHAGRETGESIKADTDTTGVRAFIDSHYQPVAGTLYNKAGYEYAGQNYDSLGSHKLLGAASQGPCVTCHMPGKDHTFVAAGCGTCHGVTAPVLNAANLKATYDAALNELKLALQAKGIHYGPVHPFFFTAPYVKGGTNAPFTNWAGPYGAGSWKDTMGAAFNYNLLWSEKGAYAHNYGYAMKLTADSIDFLSGGTVGP